MRSDFWSLPYAAQQAIRRGETEAANARRRGWTIAQLEKRIKELEDQNAALGEALSLHKDDRDGD